MVDVVLATIITTLITSVGALAVGLVNHLKSSSCWGISAEFDSTTQQPINTAKTKS